MLNLFTFGIWNGTSSPQRNPGNYPKDDGYEVTHRPSSYIHHDNQNDHFNPFSSASSRDNALVLNKDF